MENYLGLAPQEALLEQEYYILDALSKNTLPRNVMPKENALSHKTVGILLIAGSILLGTYCAYYFLKDRNEVEKGKQP
jgi:hypothetical protein